MQYFAGGAPPLYNWHAHSLNGIDFVQEPNYFADSLMLANGIRLSNGYRFFGFGNLPPGGIRSLYSLDGEHWTVEPGYRLQLDTTSGLESLTVKDPAIVFKDTVFIMYYVTRKPLTGIEESELQKANNISLEISPNPGKNRFEIRWFSENQQIFAIKIFDISGSLVRSWNNVLAGESEKIIWYGDNEYGMFVQTGFYFIYIENANIKRKGKIILIR